MTGRSKKPAGCVIVYGEEGNYPVVVPAIVYPDLDTAIVGITLILGFPPTAVMDDEAYWELPDEVIYGEFDSPEKDPLTKFWKTYNPDPCECLAIGAKFVKWGEPAFDYGFDLEGT